MSKLSVSAASRAFGIPRRTLRDIIKRRSVPVDPKGMVDTADLERLGYTMQQHPTIPQETTGPSRKAEQVRNTAKTPQAGRTLDQAPSQPEWVPSSATVHLKLGGRQVQLTLHDTDETRLLARMEALLQQYPDTATPAYDMPHGPRPAPMRQRIRTLLQDYPAGLKRVEIQQNLRVEHNLSDVLVGMVKSKLLTTNGKGIYVLVPGESPTQAS
jgi:hypothetical protein